MEPLKRISEDPNAVFALVAMVFMIKSLAESAAHTVWYSRTKLGKFVVATGKKITPGSAGEHTDTH